MPWFRNKRLPEGSSWLCRLCLREWKHFFETGEMIFYSPRGSGKKWVP